MNALRWFLAIVACALLLVGMAGFARQQQLDAVDWGVCGKHRAPCAKGAAENGTPWALAYLAARDELLFVGGMGKSFDVVVASALRRFPQVKRVVVAASSGGSVNGVVRAAKQLNQHAVEVRIDGDCASACALLWALADRRLAVPRARIGLHAGRPDDRALAWLHAPAEARGHRVFETALRGAGFPPDVILRGMETPHDRIYWIDVPAMQRIGVRFGRVEPVAVSSSGSDPPPAPRS